MANDQYAAAEVWDTRHRTILDAGDDRDRSGQWLLPFLPLIAVSGATSVLDLGCGTGYDALELARRGLHVSGIDYSQVAIDQARSLAQAAWLNVAFCQGDVGQPLPYSDGEFDVVISNLVLHSFSDHTLRRIVLEVRRCLRPGGLFLFHANSTEDIARRTLRQPPDRQIDTNFFVLAGGQSMHFLSEEYVEELLAGWTVLELAPISARDSEGNLMKSVWRCSAQKPA